jgi:hypothetical protein
MHFQPLLVILGKVKIPLGSILNLVSFVIWCYTLLVLFFFVSLPGKDVTVHKCPNINIELFLQMMTYTNIVIAMHASKYNDTKHIV